MNKLEFTRFPELKYACGEALNTLCTNISFFGSNVKIIMITSSRENEGKSFLAINIMRTFAHLGKRVVLVDGDLRKSRVETRFGVKTTQDSRGFAHYLAGMCNLGDVLYTTNIPGASIVPVGHEVTNSLPLLSSPLLGKLLSSLSERFDYVLVDAPPIGVIVDAAQIARYCDGVLVAVQYNAISRWELADACAQIRRTNCPILGAVLNEVSFDTLSSKKYYNKPYYSHYDSVCNIAPKPNAATKRKKTSVASKTSTKRLSTAKKATHSQKNKGNTVSDE